MKKHQSQEICSDKQSKFRVQIRKQQLKRIFKVYRHSVQNIDEKYCKQVGHANFEQLQSIINKGEQGFFNNPRLGIILKQLRQINCSHQVEYLFASSRNVNLLLTLQNSNSLAPIVEIYLHQILVNVSGYENQQCKNGKMKLKYASSLFSVQDLRLNQILNSDNSQLICWIFQILGNLLLRDQNSSTLYYLLKKKEIIKIMMKFLYEKRYLFNNDDQGDEVKFKITFVWFSKRLIESITYFAMQNISDDFKNFALCLYEEFKGMLNRHYQKDFLSNNTVLNGDLNPNDIFKCLSTLIKSKQIILDEDLLQKSCSYFSVENPHYLSFLQTLTKNTLYQLPQELIEAISDFIIKQPQYPTVPTLLSILNYTLSNNSTPWRIVFQRFLNFRVFQQNNHVGLLDNIIPFLKDPETQVPIAQILCIFLIEQDGLGVFEDHLEELEQYQFVRKKFDQIGVYSTQTQ